MRSPDGKVVTSTLMAMSIARRAARPRMKLSIAAWSFGNNRHTAPYDSKRSARWAGSAAVEPRRARDGSGEFCWMRSCEHDARVVGGYAFAWRAARTADRAMRIEEIGGVAPGVGDLLSVLSRPVR